MRATWVVWGLFVGGLATFAGLAWQVQVQDSVLKQIDLEVAKKDKQHADEHPRVLYIAKEATHVGAVQAMVVLAVCGALLLLMCGQTKLAVVWVLAAGM